MRVAVVQRDTVPTVSTRKVALLGDKRGHRCHQELEELSRQLETLYPSLTTTWVPTNTRFDVAGSDGIWLIPGSPYADGAAVIEVLRQVRSSGTPFLGTCGGMQYAVMEYLRTEHGLGGTHAESDGPNDDNAVVALACSLYGVEGVVAPVPGTRFASWVPEPFVGMHFCNYAPSADSIATLESTGVVVGATGSDVGAEVLEFPNHPFYVTSMFQPHIGALDHRPVHPLVTAFVKSVLGA